MSIEIPEEEKSFTVAKIDGLWWVMLGKHKCPKTSTDTEWDAQRMADNANRFVDFKMTKLKASL